MTRCLRAVLLAFVFVAGVPNLAQAGMPSITLTDIARSKSTGASPSSSWDCCCPRGFVQLLWNYLRRDFSLLPRLSYGKAVGVVGLWGLLFVLVLTMISGAARIDDARCMG